MKNLFDRIKIASQHDKAVDAQSMLLYVTEELGEVATCIAVEEGLKDRVLKEPKESELCDIIISAAGLILRNPEWDYDRIVQTMGQKLPKWESRVIKGAKDDKSYKGEEGEH